MDKHVDESFRIYGETVLSELAMRAIKPGKQNIVDNIAKVSNVRFLKGKGLYVVFLYCEFETQVERRLNDPTKNIDPTDRPTLEEQVRSTNAFFEIDGFLALADVGYDTEKITVADYTVIGKEILTATER